MNTCTQCDMNNGDHHPSCPNAGQLTKRHLGGVITHFPTEEMVHELAMIIWNDRCPGMTPSDADLDLYTSAARAAWEVLCGRKAEESPLSVTDDDLRTWWRRYGGDFHGPRVEQAYMEEAKLFGLLRAMIKARSIQLRPKRRRSRFTVGACVWVKKDKNYALVVEVDKHDHRSYICVQTADGITCWWFADELILLPAKGPEHVP